MRFLMLMIPKAYDGKTPPRMPTAEEVAPMMAYNEALTKAGLLVTLDGLAPPDTGARIRFGGPKPVVSDGPFAEAREAIGGYWILRVKSRDEAIAWAEKCPAGAGDVIEVRQIFDASDYAEGTIPEISPELQKIGESFA